MRLPLLVAAAACLCAASPASAADSCAADPEACTLAEVADEAGFFAGAAVDHPERIGVPETVGAHFNSLTPENAMKWGQLARRVGEYDFARADALVALAEARGVRVRGHALLWGRGPLPSDLDDQVAAAPDPATRLTELIEDHVRTVAGRYAGRVEAWDVVNEPLDVFGGALGTDLFARTLGESYLDVAFRAARAADPGARLHLNEFFGSYDGEKARAFLALVQRLLDRGVPIDGVGVQAHQNPQPGLTAPYEPAFAGFLAELAALGLEIELTEVDVTIFWFLEDPDPLAAQARAYGQLARACTALPACRGFTTWGVTDADTWLDEFFPWSVLAPNRPLLFDEALMPKPAYEAVRAAIAERIPDDTPAARCPCAGPADTERPWRSRGEYLGCVVGAATALADEGRLTRREAADAIARAARSGCGRSGVSGLAGS